MSAWMTNPSIQVKSLGYTHAHVTRPAFRRAEKVGRQVIEDDVYVPRARRNGKAAKATAAKAAAAAAANGSGGQDADDVTASIGTLFSDLGQGFGQWKAPDNIFEKLSLQSPAAPQPAAIEVN